MGVLPSYALVEALVLGTMSARSDEPDSVGKWIADGIAWEISTFLMAVPLIVGLGIVAWVASWSFNQALAAFLVIAVAYRLVLWIGKLIRRPG